MFAFLTSLSVSKKIDVEFSVKFTSSCPNSGQASYLIIDYDDTNLIPALLKNVTHVRVKPGKHHVEVTHPWCNFYPLNFEVNEEGQIKAQMNGTVYTKMPVPIKHPQMVDITNSFSLFSMGLQPMLLIGGAMFLFKKICSPEKIQQLQQNMQEQQRKLQEEQRKRKTE